MKMVEKLRASLDAQMEAQQGDVTPSSVQRERGLVWLEGWFDLSEILRALEVPTEGMVEAGQAVDGTITAKDVWSAMIAAAREE